MAPLRLLILLTITTAAYALDLTPMQAVREVEGVKIPVLQFSDGSTMLSYTPPAGWVMGGGGDSVRFVAPGSGQNSLSILSVPKRPEDPQSEALSSASFLPMAQRFLPGRATNVKLLRETATPFTIEGHPSFELTFGYVVNARSEIGSVAVVNRSATEWLVVVIVGEEQAFERIHAEAISSLFSWRVAKK